MELVRQSWSSNWLPWVESRYLLKCSIVQQYWLNRDFPISVTNITHLLLRATNVQSTEDIDGIRCKSTRRCVLPWLYHRGDFLPLVILHIVLLTVAKHFLCIIEPSEDEYESVLVKGGEAASLGKHVVLDIRHVQAIVHVHWHLCYLNHLRTERWLWLWVIRVNVILN